MKPLGRVRQRLGSLAAYGDRYHHEHEEDAKSPTAASMGYMACRHCGAVWKDAQDGEPCGRCGTHLHTRKPQSLKLTWAFLIAACMMYVPANLLPVMITRTLFGTQNDTILSGVIYFWVSGAYGLAAIVFIASFLVPLFKLAVLLLLVVLAQRGSTWRRRERAKLYHIIEIIGRWSMLDVFVVSLLTGLVQIQGFAVITAGVGIAAFGSVVVLTMLASLSFDPKLTWDSREDQAILQDNEEAARHEQLVQGHEKRDEKPA
ncbi:paraquat-inducible protein A [Variovorax paradoxus]|nr:paraquat-inducible protein A [Variovorax paradoxus]